MLTFELNLDQRDAAIFLLNQLNAIIFSDDQPTKEINDCALATNRLIIMLNNLKPVQEDSSDGAFDRATDGPPAKRSKTEAVEQIVFEIQLDTLLRIILQVIKNQKAAIRFRSSVGQNDKVRLLQENVAVICTLQRLSLKTRGFGRSDLNGPVDGRSGGESSGGSDRRSSSESGRRSSCGSNGEPNGDRPASGKYQMPISGRSKV